MNSHKLPGEIVVDGMKLPGEFITKEAIDKIKTFKMTNQDTVIATFPRSGTTWVSEIAYLINSNFDFDSAKKEYMINRVPFLEEGNPIGSSSPIDIALQMKPPRVMKTHLPFKYFQKHVLEDKAKAVVVIRNPKDTLVSFYYMYKANKVYGRFSGTWQEYLDMVYSKELAHNDWFEMNNSWWEQRHLQNVLVLKYEDLKLNFEPEVKKLADFMGREISSTNMEKLKEHVNFGAMQSNPFVNPKASHDSSVAKFVRKGEIGDWKNHFTVAQSEQFDLVYKPKMDKAGMTFIYE